MAEWRVRTAQLPPGLSEVTDAAAEIVSGVATFLDAVSIALEAAAAFSSVAFDGYTSLVNAFISQLQTFLSDFKETGVSVLIDYPQNVNIARFNPTNEANLAGTIVDIQTLKTVTTDDVPQRGGQNRLQAIIQRRRDWNPASQSAISYDQAIERIATAFNDTEDPLRPIFSSQARTVGVVLMAHTTEVATYFRVLDAFNRLLALEDFAQLQWPGIQDWLDDVKKPMKDLTETELAQVDFTAPFGKRGGGAHPNFVLNTRLGDLFPGLGDAIDALSQLLEQLRPNGPITDFIRGAIDALKRKIKRLQDLIDRLEELTDQLRNAFEGTAFESVVIESNTGNSGFIAGLRGSTGHPEFDYAFVVSVLIYAGGPAASTLKLIFGSAGERIKNTTLEAVAAAENAASRPVRRP